MTDSVEPTIDATQPNSKEWFVSGLFFWQFKKLLPINLFAVVIVGLYVLLRVAPMTIHEMIFLFGILIHCWLIVWKLWRTSFRQAGFLYSWGFTRDQIWRQTLLASFASGVLVCGAAWLLMLFQVRSLVQDQLIVNPYFLNSTFGESWVPWVWLYGYVVVLPMMHYAWVRSKHSARGKLNGWVLMSFGVAILIWSFFQSSPTEHWKNPVPAPFFLLLILVVAFILATALLLIAGRRLHGTMESR